MFDKYPDITPGALSALRDFVGEHREGLLNAAELLGASGGLHLAQSVLDGLADPDQPSARTLAACTDLLDLLMLEHVHVPSSVEAAQFAAIDPAWPVVEEVCILADGLKEVVEDYFDETGHVLEQEAA